MLYMTTDVFVGATLVVALNSLGVTLVVALIIGQGQTLFLPFEMNMDNYFVVMCKSQSDTEKKTGGMIGKISGETK